VVLEPPELVDMFRETAQGLAQMYGAEDDVAQERGAP
jgi:hypothetical protein